MGRKKATVELTTKRNLLHKSDTKGIYYRESPSRSFVPKGSTKARPERCWVIRFTVTGKPKPIQETVGWESEVEWENVLGRLAELKKGSETNAERKKALEKAATINEFWDDTYKPAHQNDPKCKKSFPITVQRYDKYFRNTLWMSYPAPNPLFAEGLGSLKVVEITPLVVSDFWIELNKTSMSLASKVHVMIIFRQIINYAMIRGIYTGQSPFFGFKMPSVGSTNKRIQWFRPTEMGEIMKKMADPKAIFEYGRNWIDYHKELYDAAFLSLMTGLRAGEIVQLRGINLKKDTNSLQLLDTKNGETFEIKLPEQVTEMLKRRIETLENAGDLIFPSFKGKHDRLSDRFSNVLDKLGYNKGIKDRRQRYSFHTLRHTYISWMMIQTRGNVPVVQYLARHKTLEMTMRYTHLAQENVWEAINTLNGTFTLPKPEHALIPATL